jgi:CheY-like chemotaxis protein
MSQSKTCLLIDDDQDDQEIFIIALNDSGQKVNCSTASNALSGLRHLDDNQASVPDYIFLDLNMPGMNGKQCLEEIKSRPFLKHVPVIIFSTSARPQDITETKQLGATAFITKPSSVRSLSRLLSEFFEKHS